MVKQGCVVVEYMLEGVGCGLVGDELDGGLEEWVAGANIWFWCSCLWSERVEEGLGEGEDEQYEAYERGQVEQLRST